MAKFLAFGGSCESCDGTAHGRQGLRGWVRLIDGLDFPKRCELYSAYWQYLQKQQLSDEALSLSLAKEQLAAHSGLIWLWTALQISLPCRKSAFACSARDEHVLVNLAGASPQEAETLALQLGAVLRSSKSNKTEYFRQETSGSCSFQPQARGGRGLPLAETADQSRHPAFAAGHNREAA